MIIKYKEYGTTANLQRHGHPSELTGLARTALITEINHKPCRGHLKQSSLDTNEIKTNLQ